MPDIQLKLSRTCGCQVDINLNQAFLVHFQVSLVPETLKTQTVNIMLSCSSSKFVFYDNQC